MRKSILAIAMILSAPAFAQDIPSCQPNADGLICGPAGVTARLTNVDGVVSIMRNTALTPAKASNSLASGDRVVSESGTGQIFFGKVCVIAVQPNTTYSLSSRDGASCVSSSQSPNSASSEGGAGMAAGLVAIVGGAAAAAGGLGGNDAPASAELPN